MVACNDPCTAPVPATPGMKKYTSTMVACNDPCTAPVPATPGMKEAPTSNLLRSRRLWTRSRGWLVALSIVLVAASSACALVGASALQDDGVDTAADVLIVVGKEKYRTPFTQYSLLVEDVLQSRPAYYSSDNPDPYELIAQADWLLYLGVAHRRGLEEGGELTGDDFQELSKSANALQEGIALMELVREQYPAQRLTVDLRLAELYVNLAETNHMSAHKVEYDIAMKYFVRAEYIYRAMLESEEPIAWSSDDGSDPYRGASRLEVEIRWGHCCHRIGEANLDIAQKGESLLTILISRDALQVADPETEQENFQALIATTKATIVESAGNAEREIRKAVNIFIKVSQGGYKNRRIQDYQMADFDIYRHLATALSNLGTAVSMTGDLEGGIGYTEQAIGVFKNLYPLLPIGMVKEDATMTIADMLYAMADQHLQLGKYDKAKEHYSKAMEWNSENNIPPSEDLGGFVHGVTELDDAIDEHEAQLDAYNVLNNQGMDIEVSDYEDQLYLGKDDLYEGDIHMSLGSLFLAKGDLVSAGSHLSQSIKLYELSGEEEDRNLADAKFNMSVLKYRTGEYALSREFYDSALDIYRDVVGAGIDPRMAGMDPSEIPRASPRLPEDYEARNADVSMLEDLAELEMQMEMESETMQQKEKEGAIHEDWVDLDDVKEMRMNKTIREEL
jgi:tetratricopeptide (TPR) repeat protein